ncbi:hypothetical protein FKM82_002334 [Ascaphus truei]
MMERKVGWSSLILTGNGARRVGSIVVVMGKEYEDATTVQPSNYETVSVRLPRIWTPLHFLSATLRFRMMTAILEVL